MRGTRPRPDAELPPTRSYFRFAAASSIFHDPYLVAIRHHHASTHSRHEEKHFSSFFSDLLQRETDANTPSSVSHDLPLSSFDLLPLDMVCTNLLGLFGLSVDEEPIGCFREDETEDEDDEDRDDTADEADNFPVEEGAQGVDQRYPQTDA